MDDEDSTQGRAPAYRTARMEAVSDDVFAIAITLLVLEAAYITPFGLIKHRSSSP
jgi:hypothetical protein